MVFDAWNLAAELDFLHTAFLQNGYSQEEVEWALIPPRHSLLTQADEEAFEQTARICFYGGRMLKKMGIRSISQLSRKIR